MWALEGFLTTWVLFILHAYMKLLYLAHPYNFFGDAYQHIADNLTNINNITLTQHMQHIQHY